MSTSTPSSSDDLDDNNISDNLEAFDEYIIRLAKRYVPRPYFPVELIDMEIDEIAQKTRVKFWMARQRHSISRPHAYIKVTVLNIVIDTIRAYKHMSRLPLDSHGELSLELISRCIEYEVQDPADEFEHEESLIETVMTTVKHILSLPPRQQEAVLYTVKKNIIDLPPLLIETLALHGLDIEMITLPSEREEAQRIRASLSVAQKKLRALRASHEQSNQ